MTASLTLSTFSGVRAVVTGPGGFFFIIVPLARKDVTHLKMVLWLGMFPWHPILKQQQNSCWFSIFDSPLFTKLSYANTRCSNVHCGMTSTEMHGLTSFNAPYPTLYPLYLLRNIHFKNIRFPWHTLYNWHSQTNANSSCKKLQTVPKLICNHTWNTRRTEQTNMKLLDMKLYQDIHKSVILDTCHVTVQTLLYHPTE